MVYWSNLKAWHFTLSPFTAKQCSQLVGSPCLSPSLCCQVATQDLVVVLNKVDLLPAEARPKLVAKAKKRLAQTLSATKFAGCHMVAVAAKPGGPGCCD